MRAAVEKPMTTSPLPDAVAEPVRAMPFWARRRIRPSWREQTGASVVAEEALDGGLGEASAEVHRSRFRIDRGGLA